MHKYKLCLSDNRRHTENTDKKIQNTNENTHKYKLYLSDPTRHTDNTNKKTHTKQRTDKFRIWKKQSDTKQREAPTLSIWALAKKRLTPCPLVIKAFWGIQIKKKLSIACFGCKSCQFGSYALEKFEISVNLKLEITGKK